MGGRRDEHAHTTSTRGHRRRAVALAVLVAALTTGIPLGTAGRARAAVGTRPVARAAFTGCDGDLGSRAERPVRAAHAWLFGGPAPPPQLGFSGDTASLDLLAGLAGGADEDNRDLSAPPPREWTVGGRRVAVRRSPLPSAAYGGHGGHGVDYAPDSCPSAPTP